MLVGRGLIARSFADLADDPAVTIFASGVSNSLETRLPEFDRERTLLEAELARGDTLFIYFSTTSVADTSDKVRPYAQHKLAMEDLIATRARRYLVLRLPQVVGWGARSETIIEYMRQRILSGEAFQVWTQARRRLIDVDDVSALCRYFIAHTETHNTMINLVPPIALTALEIVQELEKVVERKGNYTLVDMGGDVKLDAKSFMRAARALGLRFDTEYPRRVIRKYYGAGRD